MRKFYLLKPLMILTIFLSSKCFAQKTLMPSKQSSVNRHQITAMATVAGKFLKLSTDNRQQSTVKASGSVLTTVFGYVYGDPSGKLPVGPAYTFLERPDSIVSLANQSGMNPVFGGTWCDDDKWYGTVYGDSTLITIDIATGVRTKIGNMGIEMLDIAYDHTTNTLWGITWDGNTSNYLYKIDRNKGKATLIGKSAEGLLINLACDTLGNLYSLNISDSLLYSVNKSTGAGKAIGKVGFITNFAQGMEFDRLTNICYMSAYNYGMGRGELRTCDVTTGKSTLIGVFQGGAQTTGFAIPYLHNKVTDAASVSVNERTIIPLGPFSPKASFMNRGLPATFDVIMKISNGNSDVYTSTKTISNLGTFAYSQIIFDKWTPVVGDYTFTIYTMETGDINPLNDTIQKSVSVQKLITAYCYEAYDPSGKIPNGPVLTYLQTPDQLFSIAGQASQPLVYAGTWGASNKWYCVLENDSLITIDTLTGARHTIGNTGQQLEGLTYDFTTGSLYGTGNDGTYSSLYKINKVTAAATLIGRSVKGTLINLACDTLGKLYSLNISNDSLYSVNKQTGVAKGIGPVGFVASYLQGMDFDKHTNICYMAAFNNSIPEGELRTVDLTTGETTLIGGFADKSEITGFAIPFLSKAKYVDAATLFIDELPIMPVQTIKPLATVMNKGKDTTFNVTMQILNAKDSVIYTSVKSVTLSSLDATQIAFDPWSAVVGNYTITVYTQLKGDVNLLNDTLKQAISVQNLTKAYCYVTKDPTGLLPAGPAYIYLEAPLLVTSIANQASLASVAGSTWGGNNKWYGKTNANTLVTLDTASGKRTNLSTFDKAIAGIAFDYKTNTLFGVGSDGPQSYLYRISRATGATELIGTGINGKLISLVCDTSGNLFAMNSTNDSLYSINKKTGAGTGIGPLAISKLYVREMGINPKTNTCFFTTFNPATKSGEMRNLDLSTGKNIVLGTLAGRKNVDLGALVIPNKHSVPLTDIAISAESSPVTGCGLTNNETVTITVENTGINNLTKIPVHYKLDGGNPVDTTLASIPSGGFNVLSFNKKANLSAGGSHTITAYTTMAGDNNSYNDTLKYIVDNVTPATIPFSMGFEPNESFIGWHIFDFNNDHFTWYISPAGGHNGPHCAQISDNPNVSSDDYLFTSCIQLQQGKSYKLSLWTKCVNPIFPESMSVILFSKPDITAYVSLITDLHNITDNVYKESENVFTVDATASYYIGFHCYSSIGKILSLDDISIQDVTGINQLSSSNEQLSVYPNPAKNSVNILSSANIRNIRMLNVFGQIISDEAVNNTFYLLNTSSVEDGIYLIQIETKKGITTRKIVISK